jgi:hypothetical protein
MEEHRERLAVSASSLEVLSYILSLEEGTQMKLIVLLWQWWKERNRIREGEKRRGAEDMVYVIEKNAVEFMHLWSEDAGVSNKSVQHWRRPLDDVVKINSDGSYMAGTGALCRSW